MISTSNLGKSFGGRTLFEGVSMQLNTGARYGLVGANGSGKTTCLRVFAGDDSPSEGSVNIPKRARVGVLRQDRFLDDAQIILEVAMMGDRPVWQALDEQRRLSAGGPGDATRIAELDEFIRAHDGYTLEARAGAVLEGLGIPAEAHGRPLATLSGGFKLRMLLAQVLLGGPDVLLLDEPTNHLDILSIRWLEKFLAGYKGCAVVVSHDQRFLDNVATHILDVDYETITLYTGNYEAFVKEKQATRARKEAEIARAEKIIAEKRAFVERFGAKATKAKQAQSRLKQIEKIEVEELADTSRRAPHFRFTPARASGRDVLGVEGVSKAYGDKVVLRGVSIAVRRGEKVAIIGPNGLGKSTLLKIITDRLAPDAGRVAWGHEARVGYFAQDHRELLDDPRLTPLSFLWAACPLEGTSFVRGQLGRALFSGDDVEKSVGALSGGEAARLIFARLIVEKPNVLVLDEPTNHLDLESIHALVEGLRAFEGTVIFVSHDRWFVSELATRVVEVTPTGLRDFPGTYAEYLERCGDDHLDADAVALKAKRERAAPAGGNGAAAGGNGASGKGNGAGGDGAGGNGAAGEGSWEEQKRRRNRQKALPAQRDRVLAEVEAAEARRKAIQEMYCTAGFFEQTPAERVAALEAEDKQLAASIETLTAEWERLEAEIESLGAN